MVVKKKRFRMDTKMVVQIRYYERMYLIHDNHGERVYTGADKKTAEGILRALNGYRVREERKEILKKKRGKRAR